jgi:DNA-binding NarL/FixJ family response regulator
MLTSTLDDKFYFDLLMQLPGIVVVMDVSSKFICTNSATAKTFGFKNQDSVIGRDAFEIRCPASESAPHFIQQDNMVMSEKRELNILDIHTYADNSPKILLTKKKPLVRKNEVVGVICYCTELQSVVLKQICTSLIQSDKMYYSNQLSADRSYLLGETKMQSDLTDREKEVVFFMLRGQTIKQIAQSMHISPRTVETHKENIKQKWSCTMTSEIVDKAISLGYLNFLPSAILSKEMTRVL